VTKALATKAAEAAFEKSQQQIPPEKRKIASQKLSSTRHAPARERRLVQKLSRSGLNPYLQSPSAYSSWPFAELKTVKKVVQAGLTPLQAAWKFGGRGAPEKESRF
jgi:hypothetical protein